MTIDTIDLEANAKRSKIHAKIMIWRMVNVRLAKMNWFLQMVIVLLDLKFLPNLNPIFQEEPS